nr:MAG TPA: hypothetical protein [Caudoviricetes sp.]
MGFFNQHIGSGIGSGGGGGSPTNENAMTSVGISANGNSYEFKNASSVVVGVIPLMTDKDIDNILNSLN